MMQDSSSVYLASISRLSSRSRRRRSFSCRSLVSGDGEPCRTPGCVCCSGSGAAATAALAPLAPPPCSSCSMRATSMDNFSRSAAERIRSSLSVSSSACWLRVASSTCHSSSTFCCPMLSSCSRNENGAPTRGAAAEAASDLPGDVPRAGLVAGLGLATLCTMRPLPGLPALRLASGCRFRAELRAQAEVPPRGLVGAGFGEPCRPRPTPVPALSSVATGPEVLRGPPRTG
mmetsp:Transcript_66700/g.171768  ORF Transcript_66700/g.171768 Transcript_66700/m.171768 type:complete len:231 (+) Transcript_66700:668-1360(+)